MYALKTLHEELRAATRSLHDKVEALPLPQRMLQPHISRADYSEYLLKMHTVHTYAETVAFKQLKAFLPCLDSRNKTGKIKNDLSLTGISTVDQQVDLPHTDVPVSFAWGMMYVSEGSTLGGLHILKHIRSVFPEIQGTGFLQGYGEKTGSMWKDFLLRMNAYSESEASKSNQEIIEGAVHFFSYVHEIMKKNPVDEN